MSKIGHKGKSKQYVLVWVWRGIIQNVWLYSDPKDAIKEGRRIARDEGYDEATDCIDVFVPGQAVAYWQFRDKEE